MFRTNVNEMNVQPINLGHEMWQGVEPCLDLAPVVTCRPIAREFLNSPVMHALGFIHDSLPVGPPRRRDAPADLDELLFRDVDAEGADCITLGCGGQMC